MSQTVSWTPIYAKDRNENINQVKTQLDTKWAKMCPELQYTKDMNENINQVKTELQM